MSRLRIEIRQLVLQHPSLTAAEAARLGRMVEFHLAGLVAASGASRAQNVDLARAHVPLPSGAGTAHTEMAIAIALGIHQSISGKG